LGVSALDTLPCRPAEHRGRADGTAPDGRAGMAGARAGGDFGWRLYDCRYSSHEGTDDLDPLAFLAEHSTALWGAVSGAVSGIGMFLLSFRKVSASVEHARMKMAADAAKVEIGERAAFRASLMNELAGLRAQIKACEADKNQLRERLYNAEAEILVLKASNEIMEKWVAFFRDGISPQASSLALVTRREVRP
jgi:hypothetical protein